jgi:hypothetical protein
MPTYTATMAARGNSAYTAGPAGQVYTAYSSYSITTAFVLNDVIEMLRVPAGARITGVTLKTSDLDTSTGIVLDVGDAADTDRLIDGATIGQTGGTTSSLVSSTGQFYKYTSETVISVLVQVAATGTAATSGTVELAVSYVLQ